MCSQPQFKWLHPFNFALPFGLGDKFNGSLTQQFSVQFQYWWSEATVCATHLEIDLFRHIDITKTPLALVVALDKMIVNSKTLFALKWSVLMFLFSFFSCVCVPPSSLIRSVCSHSNWFGTFPLSLSLSFSAQSFPSTPNGCRLDNLE